jgi:site-specific recombinase XerD
MMTDTTLLGPFVRRFLLEHLITNLNSARNTQRSYRDTLVLLIPYLSRQAHKEADKLTVNDLSADVVRSFLLYL